MVANRLSLAFGEPSIEILTLVDYPELKAYFRHPTKWRRRYHENRFDAVAGAVAALKHTN